MRVRVLKDFSTANRSYHIGEIINVSLEEANALLRYEFVMQDKSLDGAKETKVNLITY